MIELEDSAIPNELPVRHYGILDQTEHSITFSLGNKAELWLPKSLLIDVTDEFVTIPGFLFDVEEREHSA